MSKSGAGMPSKKKRKVPSRGSMSGDSSRSLSPAQEEVLHLLTNDFLTVKQIALRRQTTIRAVNKIKRKLIEKGLLGIVPRQVLKTGGPSTLDGNLDGRIRLHAEHFLINIIQCDGRYRERVKKGTVKFVLDAHTVMLHRNSIEVYSGMSFYGETPGVADHRAMDYWTRYFTRLEQEVKAILLKPRSQNITRVRAEFADMRNELATSALKEHEKIRIVGDDGRVWLIVDNSFSLQELETVHKTRSKGDMQSIVQPFFNDLRDSDGNVLLPQAASQLMVRIEQNIMDLQRSVADIAKLQALSVKKFDTLVELEKARLQGFKMQEPGEDDLRFANYFG